VLYQRLCTSDIRTYSFKNSIFLGKRRKLLSDWSAALLAVFMHYILARRAQVLFSKAAGWIAVTPDRLASARDAGSPIARRAVMASPSSPSGSAGTKSYLGAETRKWQRKHRVTTHWGGILLTRPKPLGTTDGKVLCLLKVIQCRQQGNGVWGFVREVAEARSWL
jgi:hypothetical protein